MGVSPDVKYAWPSTANVANFVTVKPCVEGDETFSHFKNWKAQMVCLLESQDVLGFVNGEIPPPEEDETEQHKLWRRTDSLVKGWILGTVGVDVLNAGLREKQTARDAWLEMENIFNQQQKDDEDSSEQGADFSRYLPLRQAAMRGDWDTAKNFFEDMNELSTTIISSSSETALHIAVLTGKANISFVNKLVEMMPHDALALKDFHGDTALHKAAMVGNKAAAIALVNKYPELLYIFGDTNRLPVQEAVVNCHKETFDYLISHHVQPQPKWDKNNILFEGQLGLSLLTSMIASEFVDIAFDLARKYPHLSLLTDKDDGRSILSTIAETETLFLRTETFSWWQNFIYHRIPLKKSKSKAADHTNTSTSVAPDVENLSSQFGGKLPQFQLGQKVESMIWYAIENLVPKVKELREKKARHQQALRFVEYLCDHIASQPEKEASSIFQTSIEMAAKYGISEIMEMIIDKYPDVIYYSDANTGRNVFMVAAYYRFQNVINLIYNMSDRRYLFFNVMDNENNNIMHACAKLAHPHRLNLVAGAALQMQRELQWFKEMENFVHPSRRIWTNKKGKTAQMVFTEKHEKLKADGERWMKDTANACTIAAALIATVMFAAAFTVPGGLNSDTGTPLFSSKRAFKMFAVSDAISLFTSITSLLMFLAILTSRYAEEDFLHVLPKRLSIGLISLFLSITFMLVAFSSTLYLLLQGEITWFVVLVGAFTCLPVTSFVLLQFPLLVDVVYSTYGPGIFGKKKGDRRILY